MSDVLVLWIEFAFASLAIMVGGFILVRSADRISDLTGLGRAWAGVLLLATATSIPEVVVGIGAIVAADSPNLAAGGAFGSNVANLMILAVLGLIPAWRGILTDKSPEARQLGIYGIVLSATAGALILLARVDVATSTGVIAVLPLSLPVIYLVFLHRAFGAEMSLSTIDPRRLVIFTPRWLELSQAGQRPSLIPSTVAYASATLIVVAAGLWLSDIGGRLSGELGWSESFMGSLFLAMSTSLPELAVAIAALRIGSIELALANILGSNMFNMGVVLGADAAVFGTGAFFETAGAIHVLTAVFSITMTALILYRPLPHVSFGQSAAFNWQVVVTAIGIGLLFVATSYTTFVWG